MTRFSPDIHGRDIVMVGLQPWYFKTGCNAKNIANLLAVNNRVLYVNVPIKRNAYHAADPDPKLLPHIELRRANGETLRPISQNLWELYPSSLIESVNWLPSTAAFRLLDYINNRRFARNIRKAMRTLGFTNIILFNDNDIYNGFYLKQLLKPSVYIYYFRDWLQGFAYWKKHATMLEPELIRKSDIVLTNSLWFTQYSAGINPRSYYMGQGCDFDHFDPQKITAGPPEDIASIPQPIIGYIGALDSERLDPAIIAAIAREKPEWNIVLVGPEDDTFRQSDLHNIPNIRFLGGKPFSMLASYVAAFDVCINPQRKNEITRGNYPLKIDEYLAMGKPVVATDTFAMQLFKDHAHLAETPEQYPGLIQKALEEDSPSLTAERIRFARTHSWENCMIPFYQAINDFENGQRQP
ncbi:MAG TPA: glycosyltransferase [Puia sp.]|jgi:teichuronic acid biosynthesis glycosyltransferase TuaH|nr:glycosyltransferase [Puia sp.]